MALIESPPEIRTRSPLVVSADDSSVVWLLGDHDLSTVAMLAESLRRAVVARGSETVTLDLSGVDFMDASTLSAILSARKRSHRQSGSLVLRSPSRIARRLLDVCGLGELIDQSGYALESALDTGAAGGDGVRGW